jgi:4-nitrophenyl phosphatase
VLGYDTGLTYPRLTRFCDLVRAGLPYIATHPDVNCPVEGGFAPDTGAFIALIEASTGREPDVVIGKPNPLIIAGLAERFGVSPGEIVMVGDRLYTDIALGSTAGVGTVLVLSGETKRADLETTAFQADLVCEDLAELIKFLSN